MARQRSRKGYGVGLLRWVAAHIDQFRVDGRAADVAQLQRHVCDGVISQTIGTVVAVIPVIVIANVGERIGVLDYGSRRCGREAGDRSIADALIGIGVVAAVEDVRDLYSCRIAVSHHAVRKIGVAVAVGVNERASVDRVSAKVSRVRVVPLPSNAYRRRTGIRRHQRQVLLSWLIVRSLVVDGDVVVICGRSKWRPGRSRCPSPSAGTGCRVSRPGRLPKERSRPFASATVVKGAWPFPSLRPFEWTT